MLYYACSLYTPKRVQGRRLEAANLFRANTIGLLVVILGLYMIKQQHFSRSMLVIFYAVNILLEIVLRNLIRYALRNIRRKGFNQKHILLVGYSRAAEEYIDRILAHPEWGYTVRGIPGRSCDSGNYLPGNQGSGPDRQSDGDPAGK